MENKKNEKTQKRKKEQETEKEKVAVTRAEKTERMKAVIREILSSKAYKWNEFLETAAKTYAERFPEEGTDADGNAVKGRVGSTFDVMEKTGEVRFEENVCSLNVPGKQQKEEEKTAEKADADGKAKKPSAEKKKRAATKKPKEQAENAEKAAEAVKAAEEKEEKEEKKEEPVKEETPAPKKRGRKPKAEKSEETAAEEKPAPKKRGRKPGVKKAEEKNEAPKVETNDKTEEVAAKEEAPVSEKKEEKTALAVRAEAKPAPVFDMTLLFGDKTAKTEKKEPVAAALAEVSAKAAATVVVEAEKKETAKEIATAVVTEKKESAPVNETIAERKPSPIVAAAPAPVSEKAEEKESAKPEKRANVVGKEEIKRPVLPEFAFLGNAAAKGAASAVLPREATPLSAEREKMPAPVKQAANAPKVLPAAGIAQGAPQSGRTQVPPQAKAERVQGGNGGRERRGRGNGRMQTPALPASPEEALKTEFLKRLRSLGGDYFEYYSVYLLERYSLRNGRRLEGMKVSGGERDGGIDGEITLTDKFGFRETIYIQAKNWDPSKGKEELWVIGETLLQQFIGAVACRQAKEGTQHGRGIFVTTSHFTPEAKSLLETMSDKFVGYDGEDVFEAAKECSFGLVKKNGEWVLDENLLSGGKAFFNMM